MLGEVFRSIWEVLQGFAGIWGSDDFVPKGFALLSFAIFGFSVSPTFKQFAELIRLRKERAKWVLRALVWIIATILLCIAYTLRPMPPAVAGCVEETQVIGFCQISTDGTAWVKIGTYDPQPVDEESGFEQDEFVDGPYAKVFIEQPLQTKASLPRLQSIIELNPNTQSFILKSPMGDELPLTARNLIYECGEGLATNCSIKSSTLPSDRCQYAIIKYEEIAGSGENLNTVYARLRQQCP